MDGGTSGPIIVPESEIPDERQLCFWPDIGRKGDGADITFPARTQQAHDTADCEAFAFGGGSTGHARSKLCRLDVVHHPNGAYVIVIRGLFNVAANQIALIHFLPSRPTTS